MRVLILGATGGTGREATSQASAAGHDVTVFVRDASRVPNAAGVTVVNGSLDDHAALTGAMRGQDAVVSALGRGRSFRSEGLMARAIPAIIRAMEQAGVRRLVLLSGYGLGGTDRDAPFLGRLFMRTLLKDVYRDKAIGEEALRRSDLDWTIVYATGLTNGPRRGAYRHGERLSLGMLPTISRADVADFLVRQIADATYVRKGVLLSN